MLYSASYYTAEVRYGDAWYFVRRQAIAWVVAVGVLLLASRLNPNWIRKANLPLLGVSVVLMCLVFVPHLGVESYGARRWLSLGPISMQPSELAKFAFVWSAAWWIDKHPLVKFRYQLPVLAVGGLFCALLLMEPNMSVTMIMVGLLMCMLLIGGAKGKHFLLFGVPVAGAVPALIAMEPYRLQRLLAFVDPWASPKGEGYQLIQSYYALGAGGFFGVGLLNSRQKYMFLPFAESDFIFSVVGEELGFVGALLLMGLLLYAVYLGYRIASRCPHRLHALATYGVTTVIALQSLLNVAVVTGCVPPTGVPLPFVSYGGSSLVCFSLAVGYILSVDRISQAPLGV